MDRVRYKLQECHRWCRELEMRFRLSDNLVESFRKDNKKLTSEVQDLEAKLRIAQEDASLDKAKLKSTEAQVNTLVAEKQRGSDERVALVQHVSELEVACQQFRHRAG